MAEEGELFRLKTKWWKPPANETSLVGCPPNSRNGQEGMSMANVGGVFLVLVIGCAVGLLLGVIEFLWNLREVAIQNKVAFLYNIFIIICLFK